MDLLQKLRKQGWYLTEEGLKKLSDDVDKSDTRKVTQSAMDMDFREIAGGALPNEVSKKDESITGCIVLQVVKIRNISAPKANEEHKYAPRFLQIEFTDGINQIIGLEFEHISTVSLNTPPGTKIYLKSERIPLMQGNLVLRPNDVQVLGGKVAALVEKWEISRTLQKYAQGGRIMTGSSGPPPWIPFGQKIQQSFNQDKNFKSLSSDKDKDNKENNEFEAMRNEAIAEAAKAGGKKTFGGGNQQILDYNVKKIIESGYTEEEAKSALRATKNDVERALNNLKRRSEFKMKEDFRNKNVISKRGAKDSKKSKEDVVASSKPVGNVSLFDFLTDKLPIAAESEEKPPAKFERLSESSTKPIRQSNNPPIHNHYQSKQNQYQSQYHHQNHQNQLQHQQQSNVVSNQSTRPKFENNISSSFASRASSILTENDKGRNKSGRESAQASNTYNNRRDDNTDRNRDSNRSSIYNRVQKQTDRNSNFHVGPSNSSSNTTDSRNRNGYQNKDSYDKYSKTANVSKYSSRNDHGAYQNDTRNYTDSRQSSYINDSNKINKIVEDTSKLKLDNKTRSSNTPRMQQNTSIKQQFVGSTSQAPPQQQVQSQQPQKQQQPQQQQQHSVQHNTFTQLPNGFTYDPSKIIGFQNKESNEFAMAVLKSQALNATMAPQPPSVPPHAAYPAPPMQISQHPAYPPAPFVMQQHPPAPPPSGPPFGMNPGDGWNWKVGDRCLAKYWDDGRYYDAEITGISDKTCVVYYLGYGNHEEVLKTDCLPITDAQHRPINFTKLHETHNPHNPIVHPPPQQTLNRGISNRYRGERQMYVPPPKREG